MNEFVERILKAHLPTILVGEGVAVPDNDSATIPIPEGFGPASGKSCPPRILNECIWIERNRSSGPRTDA